MEYVTYKNYNEKDSVEALINLLKKNGIDFEVSEDRDSLDSLYGGNPQEKRYYVKIKQEDFATADALLLEISEKESALVDKDHYLFTFTDEELLEILRKPDEWNELDYQLSKKILRERGKEINEDAIALLKQQRINELSKPEESYRGWIYTGYILAMLGGLIGIFIGWHLMTFKKTLPNGQRLYGYSELDRRHGGRIVVIGLIMLALFVTLTIVKEEW